MGSSHPLLLPFVLATMVQAEHPRRLAWKDCLRQKPEWYATAEAARIAENVLLHQRGTGGWPKNIDLAASLSDAEKAEAAARKGRTDSTFDNGATHGQLVFLARAFETTKREPLKDAFLKGLDYILAAQYSSGGWPQYHPLRSDYSRRITFNDGAMIGAMEVLRGVARREPQYLLVDEERRARCETAVRKGIECILRCQVRVKGVRTVWCAQHDELSLASAPARSYEKASLSGGESAGVVKFLLEIDRPGPEVVEAVEAAVRWFKTAMIAGIRVDAISTAALPGGMDRVVVGDASAPPLWARFYEIGPESGGEGGPESGGGIGGGEIGGGRPIFCGRDGVIRYSLAEIEHERRTGYAWYTDAPRAILERDYPAWRARWTPEKDALRDG